MRRPAVAGRAVPALHEGGGTTGPTEQKVKPGGRRWCSSLPAGGLDGVVNGLSE